MSTDIQGLGVLLAQCVNGYQAEGRLPEMLAQLGAEAPSFHVVVIQPLRKAADPDTFVLRCSCGWQAEAHGIENARAMTKAHTDRRAEG